ncbi:ACF2 Endo-1 [Candida maltosa Xu316]
MGFRDLKNAFKNKTYDRAPAPPPPGSSTSEQSNNPPPPPPSRPIDGNSILDTPIDTGAPLEIFRKIKHEQAPIGCCCEQRDAPIHTNNFYNNLTIGDQTMPCWPLPYSMWYSVDPDQDHGFAFNHTDASQRVFGPDPGAPTAQYYFNPPKIKSFVLSAENFSNPALKLNDHSVMSVTASLEKGNAKITIPIVQGMGFITAIYENAKPVIASQVGVHEFNKAGGVINNVQKYTAKLFNQVVWSVYSTVDLTLKDPNHIVANGPGIIQIARGDSQHYDETAGCYIKSAELSASADGDQGQYKFTYHTEGQSKSGKTIVWALPHHQEVMVNVQPTDLVLDSPTKGVMKAYVTNELVMQEQLPVDIVWEPWAVFSAGKPSYSNEVKDLIKKAAVEDVKQDVVGMANIDSMYTSGKVLDKFAHIAYVCRFILQDDGLLNEVLPKVKQAVEIFANNTQPYPLAYDCSWKGLVSTAEPGADFGNSMYNDHHFHYGYHIHAIALIASIDPNWLSNNNNLVLNYAKALVRDIASPKADQWFPQFRSMDFFNGHSWAHGIFPSGDGKDNESSSEMYHFARAIKLFGRVIGDSSMEKRGDLMLAVMKRSVNMYMLYTNDNKIQPPNFIGNKVSGILFENKIDYATYFGRGTIGDEWIHGIHMLPITPISSYFRSPQFVKEEWDQKLGGIIDRIPDGWKGILMLNKALFDPKSAWDWFARDDWDPALIDNGMSRTWSLAYIGGIL